MANVLVNESSLEDIADAIRSKNGTSTKYKPAEMADAISAISGGGITPTGTINITTNGTTDVTQYASANVAVPASAVDSGTKSISSNGTHDVVGYASASVSVPNSYLAGDEGKVVSNGALVAQTSATYTENGTYDTTLKNEVVVNVASSGGASWTLLAEETASDNVTVMTITATEAMRGYTHYMIEVEGVGTGGALYICPQLNSTSKKVSNGSSNNNASFHRKYYISPIYDGSLNITYYSLAITNVANGGSNAVATINSFNVVSYSDTVYFKAGTTMKVWGISL